MNNQSKLIFLGDSLTDWNDWGRFGPHYNAGISGDTTEGLTYRLQSILDKKPTTVVLMIGINDLLQGIPLSQIKANYTLLIESLEPIKNLLILSTLPCGHFDDCDYINGQVIALNIFLKSQVKGRGLTYVDLYKDFINSEGNLRNAFTSDGVHLSDAGYEVWEKGLISYLT